MNENKRELLKKLREIHEERKTRKRTKISEMEYKQILKTASFKCPIKRTLEECDGHPCPSRLNNAFDDYYNECLATLQARAVLREIREGILLVDNPSYSVKIGGVEMKFRSENTISFKQYTSR